MAVNSSSSEDYPDVVLVGAGIMSATLAMLLKELQPEITIQIFERLEEVAAESTDAWNNAGTGHSAFCELNYTPQLPDGSIETSKAISIAESFLVSRQFWAYLVQKDYISSPESFINRIPHISFVFGPDNVAFLKKRFAALQKSPLFEGMEFSDNPQDLAEWMPLIMEGRDKNEKVAGTRMSIGNDVNFGALSRGIFARLKEMPGVSVHTHHEVKKLKQEKDNLWKVKVKDLKSGDKRKVRAKFVFIGAGGGALPLLLKSGIPEGKGYGGFPVSGQWLICRNQEVIENHCAKVYGKAAVGSPPMSVPHLDTRMINGQRSLLFGPYAGFTTKFLKEGSKLDLPLSLRLKNLKPMVMAGADNIDLTKYLINQVMQSPDDRLEALKLYMPNARLEDWELQDAGKRVQVIKKDAEHGGVLEFGTEIVSSSDGTLAALLGASPGASTAVSIMLKLLERCFPEQYHSKEWQAKFKEIIPSFGESISDNKQLCSSLRSKTGEVLGLRKGDKVPH